MTNDAIVAAFAQIIERRGPDTFAGGPIVQPNARYLPDRWEPTLEATSLLLRRVMLYADLELDASLETYDRSHGVYHSNTIAWFAGIEAGCCRFGVDIGELADPQSLIASLCHEVAHAWRAFHGLAIADRKHEERLTDLTAIFLGFGVFMVNASERFIKRGHLEGTTAITRYGASYTGYITAEEACFALAVQIAARDTKPREIKAIARCLELNQAKLFRTALGSLDGASLRQRLGIKALPPPRALDAYTRPLEDARVVVEEKHHDLEDEPRPNDGQPVFRVPEDFVRYVVLFVGGASGGAMAGGVLAALVNNAPRAVAVSVAISIPLGVAFAFWKGGAQRRDLCSGPMCHETLPPDAVECESCGGRIAGRIARMRDHPAAKEALEENRKTPQL
jgi:hypothetical protein